MAKDGKFGTVAGVYIPSLLTILGVIMYLRLPWIIGNSGLYMALGIIGAAHIVSITTGLSVSSIATDKKVGAGGPYYILSRSLGLPIGGAIGIALVVGMGFATALHIVGFTESVLPSFGFEPTPNAIRVAGSLTLVAITIVAFISTSLAIVIQYPIAVMVVVSVIVVFLGSTDSPAHPQLTAHEGAPSFAVMFGIFFPAATGFMAGIAMSGDLRDSKTSIIRGTMTAILSAFALYVVLTVFLAYKVDPERLRNDKYILEHMSLAAPAVIAGIWGATLSSAFGALLGAPRILQAMSTDRITPHALAKGHGPSNEPRRATLLIFVIAEAGILIAELNLIARIVSMIYLTKYAAINLACVIESWASPDFRPKFRIPKVVGIIGAVACVLLMVQLDLLAMLGATALMIGLFAYLQRRQLSLESGDVWEGVWASIVRAGLHNLHKNVGQQRHWRPNVLLFDAAGHERHASVRAFATTLASGNGIVTDFALAPPGDTDEIAASAPTDKVGDKAGVFDTRLVTADPFEAISSICQFHGFTGLPPNTLLLPWRQHASDPDKFLRALNGAASRELNILLFEEPREARRTNRKIDVWWSRDAGNLAFSVALARFITRAPEWERAAIDVCIVGEGGDDDEVLRAKAMRYLATTRVDARVRVVQRPRAEDVHDLVCNESRTADLVLLGLPADLAGADRHTLASFDRVAHLHGGVVFLRAGNAFNDVLVSTARAQPRVPRAPGAPTPPAGIPVLTLPQQPQLAATVTAVVGHASTQLTRIQDRIAAAYGLYIDLCATTRNMVARRAEAMLAAKAEPDPTQRRKLLATATNEFLVEAERALAQIAADGVAAQATLLGEVLTDVTKASAAMPPQMPPVVQVERPRAMFRPMPDDSLGVRAWKRRRHWRNFYRRLVPQSIPVQALVQRDHDRILREEVTHVAERFRTATHDLATEISRTLATAEWKAHAELSRSTVVDSDKLAERLTQARDEAFKRLDAITSHTKERIAEDAQALEAAVLESGRRLSAVLDRVDAPLEAAAAARGRAKRDDLARLPAAADRWRDEQLHLLGRARLAVRLARFRDRLTIASAAALEEILATAAASGQRAVSELRDQLSRRSTEGGEDAPPELRDEVPYDASPIVARFGQVAAALSSDLPETETLLTDDAASALVRGDTGSEVATVPVRAALQAIVETDVITRLSSEVVQVAEGDARAWGVARETMLLVSARPRESEDDEAAPQGDTLTDAVARLDAQMIKLREIETACVQGVLDGLEAVATATALEGLSTSLAERGGRRIVSQRPSRLRELARRGLAAVREASARIIYRRSAGVVYAHESRTLRGRTAIQSIRELASRSAINSGVASTLPLYYRNLFTGQVNINESFFVGRDARVKAGRAVITGSRPGAPRSVLIAGTRSSGKTTLCQQIANVGKSNVTWIAAPPGGAATRGALRSAFESALRRRGTPAQLVSRLPEGSVIVIDDLDLWWERRPGGLEAIDAIIELVGELADRVGFVIAGCGPALRVIQDLRPLSRVVTCELDCQPLAARELEKVIMARHGSTGLGLKLRNRESFGTWSRARLFDAHFDYARGNVGFALRSWVTHIEAVGDEQLTIRVPEPLDWDAIDDLRAEHVALLVELVLHKAATVDKLERLTGRPAAALSDALADLVAMGLVVQNRRRIAQINPFVHVPVIDWLDRRELA